MECCLARVFCPLKMCCGLSGCLLHLICFGLSDFEFDIAFDNEIMHKYLVYSFCLFYRHVQLHSSSAIFYQKGKSK